MFNSCTSFRANLVRGDSTSKVIAGGSESAREQSRRYFSGGRKGDDLCACACIESRVSGHTRPPGQACFSIKLLCDHFLVQNHNYEASCGLLASCDDSEGEGLFRYIFELFFRPKYYVSPVNSCSESESCNSFEGRFCMPKESAQGAGWFSFWAKKDGCNESLGEQDFSSY